MAGNPDITRQNSKRSTGPKTQEGKAIASRNNLQHGLLSTEPPLIGTEDYASWEGLLAGLVEEYKPRGPLEHHLVTQIAMCILRGERAWRAEAVAGDRAVAQETLSRHYPESQPLSLGIPGIDGRAATHPEVLRLERRVLATLGEALEMAWYDAPKTAAALRRWCERPVGEDSRETNLAWLMRYLREAIEAALQEYPAQARPSSEPGPHPLRAIAPIHYLLQELTPESAWYARRATQDAGEAVAQRLQEIESTLQEIERLQAAAYRPHALSQELELIGKYETRNNRLLRQAIEQLQALQEARAPITSTGRSARLKLAQ